MKTHQMTTMMLTAAMLLAAAEAWAAKSEPIQRKQLLNTEWQFLENDSNFVLEGKPNPRVQTVTLPHDWSILHHFDKDAPAGGAGGYLPTGMGWYRRTLTLGRAYEDKKVRLYFEGVYMNSRVYVNGHEAGGWPYGYSAFWVDATPYIHIGNNEIVVCADNSRQPNCRWYAGSGIYRNVWLVTTDKTYIDDWSISCSVSAGFPAGACQVMLTATVILPDGSTRPLQRTIEVPNPRLWSPDDPYLYEAELSIPEGDRVSVTYGIRTVEYSAGRGLLLNGKPLKLNGACVHHDNGLLGAAAYDDAEYRKARLMKEAGFNAVRTAHNPPSETFLRACDELGLLVIDESFDGWREQKNPYDYSMLIDQWWQRDIDAMVLRDRLHPSIFCWSIGNEVIERKKLEVVKTARLLATRIRHLDPQHRPVTSALASWDSDWDIYDPLAAEHDIVGYNYMIHKAESDHERVPQRVMIQTESYPRDAWSNYHTVQTHDYIIGDFVWTGLDYIGESGIGRTYYEGDAAGEHWERPLYPWHAAYCGDVDLTGHRKPVSFYRSLLWNGGQTTIAVREPDGYIGKVKTSMWSTWPTLQSWTWPGWEGRPIEVEVYSRQPKVSLYLNGLLVGEQETKEMKAVFTLPYQPGTLRAMTAADSVSGLGSSAGLQTAGAPKAIRLTADPKRPNDRLAGQPGELTFVNVEIVDAQGRVVPTADTELTFTVTGAATLLAAGNADIKDNDPYFDARHRVWHGRALAVLRSTGKKGKSTLTVSAKELPTAHLHLK